VRHVIVLRALLVLLGGVALIGAVIVVYYVVSYAVLWAVGRIFPLGGRRRR
jgi:hypothetical protein